MLLDTEEFRDYLRAFRRSAWRWECQPAYNIAREQPSLAAYLAGRRKPAGLNAAWHERVRDAVSSGRTIGRARGIRRPLTDYQRRQFEWIYPDSAAAGEDIRIVDLTDDDLGLPSQDFWLLDEENVIHLNFAEDGSLVERELIDEPDIHHYIEWRETALRHAAPFADHVRT